MCIQQEVIFSLLNESKSMKPQKNKYIKKYIYTFKNIFINLSFIIIQV